MTKEYSEDYMIGYTKGFESGYAIGKSVSAGWSPTTIKLCPVCGLMEGEPCYMTTPCYYGANKNR